MSAASESEIAFGPFRLERGNARLTHEGRAVALTPKAFDVLEYLATRPDRLVTKAELLSALWPDVIVGDASVKVCVREIRKALDDGVKSPRYIETVHRRGYRFIAALGGRPAAPAAGRADGGAAAPETPAISTTSHALVVGRNWEFRQLDDCLSRAAAGERQLVFVTGGPGTGKTALVDSFLSRVAASGGGRPRPRVLTGCCFEQFGAGEPYLPVWEALGRAAREHPSPIISDLLVKHGGSAAAPAPLVATEPRAMSQRVLHEIADALESLAAAAPLVLLIEDVHWADYSTLDLVSALARRRSPARLLTLVTFRPAEPSPEKYPLRGVVRELLTARLCRELPLDPLDEAAVAGYLAARFPGSAFPTALVRRLHQRTDGHPLFLTHLLDDLVEQGVLRERQGQWRLADHGEGGGWAATLDTRIPESVQAMIESQIERLTPDEQAVLDGAAAAGVEFSAAAAAAALGRDVVQVEQACDGLARRQRFLDRQGQVEWPDGTVATRYRFVHELYHNVAYERIPAARRARLHALLGERLEAAWGERRAEEAAQLAMHFERARDWRRTLGYLRQAADAACRQYAHREAADYLRRALAALDRLPPPDRAADELPLLMNLSVNLQVTRGYAAPDVLDLLDRAHALCRQDHAADDVGALFPILWGIWVFHKVRSDLPQAEQLATRLLRLAGDSGDPALMLQAHQSMAITSLCLGNPAAAADHMERAAAAYDPERHAANTLLFGQDPGIATLAFGAVALCILDRQHDGLTASARAIELSRRISQPSSLNLSLHFAAMLHQLRGDAAAAQASAEASIELAAEEGFSFWLAGGTVLRGWALAAQGRADEGIAEIRRGLRDWLATGSRTYHSYYLGLLASALMARGDGAAIAEAIATLDKAMETARTLSEGLFEAELHRLTGRCLLRLKAQDAAAARESFSLAASIARRQQAKLFERLAAVDLVATPSPPAVDAAR